jgi:hypothetical protein
MDNSFELPILYNGKELSFSGSLITYGYSYKIAMDIFDTPVNFEPDEEGSYRALINPEEIKDNPAITKALLQTIAEALQEALQ